MDAREQRGLMIAAKNRIKQKGQNWMVPSQTNTGVKYSVCLDPEQPHCTCPDHKLTGSVCKHIYAVRFTIEREYSDDGTVTETQTLEVKSVRKTYPQNWRAYNAAQTHQKERFQTLLRDLRREIKNSVQPVVGDHASH